MTSPHRNDVAVVGAACRYVRANGLDCFRDTLHEGVEAVENSATRLDNVDRARFRAADQHAQSPSPSGLLDDIAGFDWRAFGVLPREARQMDPQHRLLLELAWEALEDAGIPFEDVAGSQTGVFIGLQWNDYFRLLCRDWSQLNGYSLLGNTSSFAATRIAHFLDLKGPTAVVDMACASSLVALHSACQSLQTGEATVALVGAADLILSPEVNLMSQSAGVLSPTGRCRTFDANGDGFVRGEGGGMVVLKPVSRLAPHDRVYGIVRNVTTRQNGRSDWVMSCSQETQASVYRAACERAGIAPSDVDYVELHGTGNPRGDLTEARALHEVFATDRPHDRPLMVGSSKPNFGHSGPAAGMAGLIKLCLSMHGGQILPTREPETLHGSLRSEGLRLSLVTSPMPLPDQDRPYRAGLTAISLSGVCAHAILEQATVESDAATDDSRDESNGSGTYVLLVSAGSVTALRDQCRNLAGFLRKLSLHASVPLRDVCYTAAVGRTHRDYRTAAVGTDRRSLAEALERQAESIPDELPPVDCRPADADATGMTPESLKPQAIAERYVAGRPVCWKSVFPCGQITSLPTYAWQREHMWPDWLTSELIGTPPEAMRQAERAPCDSTASNTIVESIRTASVDEQRDIVFRHVQKTAAEVLGRSQHELSPDGSLIDLGLDSLKATELCTRFEFDLGIRIPMSAVFDRNSVTGIADAVLKQFLAEPPRNSIAATEQHGAEAGDASPHEPFPLTDIQQAYLVGRADDLNLGSVGVHYYQEFESSDLDTDRLQDAFRQLIDRHDMLRAVVLPDGRQQILQDVEPYEIDVLDLRGLDPAEAETRLIARREEMSHHVYNPEQWPLYSIRCTRFDNEVVRTHVSIDLLMVDAASLTQILVEWGELYRGEAGNRTEPAFSFRDYVLAEQEYRNSDAWQSALSYWTNRLETIPPAPQPPAQNRQQTRAFMRQRGTIDRDRWEQLQQRARGLGLTPSGILCAAFSDVLGTWSRGDRFTINVTLCQRHPFHPDVKQLIGDFTSTFLLEVDRTGETFVDRARGIQEQWNRDLDHTRVSGIEVMRRMNRTRREVSAGSMPIVFTSLLGHGRSEIAFTPNWLGTPAWGISQTSQVSLDFQAFESDGGLVFHWDSRRDAFPEGVLDDMFSAYSGLLARLADEADWTLPPGGLAPETQVRQRDEINQTDAPVSTALLHSLFEQSAGARPDHPAVITDSRTLTYDELEQRSRCLAHRLREAGATPNRHVAIVMRKGWEQVVAALAILRSGAAYLPIDPELPAERVRRLLEIGEVSLALTQPAVAGEIDWGPDVCHLCVDEAEPEDTEALETVQGPQDLAYTIFTSGSTGEPKGVMIDHRGAVNTILDCNDRFGIGESDRVLGLSSLSFDLSVYDIFGMLAAGGAVVLPPADARRDPECWTRMVAEHRVTLWNSVPALMSMQIEYAAGDPNADLSPIRTVMLSGDWIPVSLPDRIRERCGQSKVFSLGGATEASIWSILYPIDTVDPEWSSIPYGRPMRNQTFEVLNDRLEPCPVWVPGELYIGGIGVALGYWKNEAETTARFITHPTTGKRIYRTGDLGRYLPDGNIEILGRVDFQVKIQGHRIELGEIESVLEQHADVRRAVVTANPGRSGDKRLVAYVVLHENDGFAGTLNDRMRDHLGQRLPSHMVPAVFMELNELPISRNGKVDRSQLPEPEEQSEVSGEVATPQGAVEQQVLEIVQEVLGARDFGVLHNLFDLGADSLQLVLIHRRIRESLQTDIAIVEMFRHPNIRSLVESLDRKPETTQDMRESHEAVQNHRSRMAQRRQRLRNR